MDAILRKAVEKRDEALREAEHWDLWLQSYMELTEQPVSPGQQTAKPPAAKAKPVEPPIAEPQPMEPPAAEAQPAEPQAVPSEEDLLDIPAALRSPAKNGKLRLWGS